MPFLYFLLFFKSRHELRELRRMELTMEADYNLAKLEAEGAPSDEAARKIMEDAEAAHDDTLEKYDELREALPSTLRKLTAGYELRVFWFEIFECVRKVALVGLPVFLPPGSPGQIIFGLVICFLSYGMYGIYSPYIDYGDDLLAQIAQIMIFFTLLASLITNAYPEDPVMSVLLPGFLAVPPALAFIFETDFLPELKKLLLTREDGSITPLALPFAG